MPDSDAAGSAPRLPVIDVGPLLPPGRGREHEHHEHHEHEHHEVARVAERIAVACRDTGFFYVSGHGVPAELTRRLDAASRRFFRLTGDEKTEISMERGGRAWRGYFPVGQELTSGRPDQKEGVYFGAELPAHDPRVRAGVPLHGPNLFPRQVPELRAAVLEYLDRMTTLAQAVMGGIAVSLGLPRDYFSAGYTARPTVLFRIFHYPPAPVRAEAWGVGEHTDYGLLTLLAQDDNGGLQVHGADGWIDAPPLPGTFVCNIGDMLDKLTGGHYRSTPHRVRNVSGRDRLSFPFFFDPDWDAEVPPLPARTSAAADPDGGTDSDGGTAPDGGADSGRDADAGGGEGSDAGGGEGCDAGGIRPRWDGRDPRAFTGTYGDYLLGKVSKVFPELRDDVL